MGLLTIALTAGRRRVIGTSPAVDHVLLPAPTTRRDQGSARHHLHVLWELVHVFFEQPGLLTRE